MNFKKTEVRRPKTGLLAFASPLERGRGVFLEDRRPKSEDEKPQTSNFEQDNEHYQ